MKRRKKISGLGATDSAQTEAHGFQCAINKIFVKAGSQHNLGPMAILVYGWQTNDGSYIAAAHSLS